MDVKTKEDNIPKVSSLEKVSSLGYVIGIKADAAKVVREDNSIEWCYFFAKEGEKEIVDGDFVRVYRRRHGDTYRNSARYAAYFFTPKDIATAQVVFDLGWQVQKTRLPASEDADKLILLPPCLEVKKQIE